ncbi:triose-phosphate isomerase [Desulfosporosinus metallidurans]|uniref:Triosephosphate isomerase n=1 Tax=Desulfosporosinus metallidurans TaxID=1888891 RepID=A0A1Q8QU73_9FIRM|nr:triose-phosphate isomerase family protein [Desulfosporosinus metallidurans]OLN30788.1 Triosephosphate isomerase [Desulfosporosinus metallidurans]
MVMTHLFVNLKRFEVSRAKGGLCPYESPKLWIEGILAETVKLGVGTLDELQVVYLVPEALIIPAQEKLAEYDEDLRKCIQIGCQSVFRQNIVIGGNFGAFTSSFPAASAYQLGCRWSMIAHSEERRDKKGVIAAFEPDLDKNENLKKRAAVAVDSLVNQEVLAALEQGMNILLCVGETAEERGNGSPDEQKKRTSEILAGQLKRGLDQVRMHLSRQQIVIGYEPIWAIGPGKTPPDGEYISFVSRLIKDEVQKILDIDIPVIYGGGLNEKNAATISNVPSIDGGLVALTRFTGEIGFFAADFKTIIDIYLS